MARMEGTGAIRFSAASEALSCIAPPPATRKTVLDALIGDSPEDIVGESFIIIYRNAGVMSFDG